ncbi:bifunctional 3,4-dihydroxy-2-butanone 4-phosphate synthase/GTP cyclohydrolase II [Sulfurospirillum barnesii]|uniref:3,4-dihydroxy-2-butanone 4-phosphate synthase n=1 Tax=Sulfurospirillum barnesii (strain ATCC 700032 / DSM 10660 / SES-3) TaxID=760154 RepID=I3XWF5_SULBS|nr:bifunctional 3,4-dihydroxy-2-butanone 4-phosphate synthase/GTP cyclohydrolase II [Sulfurospirillum barnesii]AFL68279.1 3,4-dihydroxy-2-butanone 4-phosphate synthase [Sulfurospirillum barnesii SES-3]
MPIQRVKQAIEDIKHGKMVMMVDDEDRENEGDLVYAATFSTPEKVNFMASEAKGLICVSLNEAVAKRLDLTPMVKNNDSQHETAFTVSVDARICSTGISAYERDVTIKILADSMSRADELVRPGHIFPLIARKGGTLVRTGHTEGSVDLCRLAGVCEVSVICEVMKEDGHMARRDDLDLFCKKHGINIVYISDIVAYRMQSESLVREVASANVEFFGAPARKIDMVDHEGNHHIVYAFGEIEKTSFVKFHHILPDNELLANEKKYSGVLKAIEHLKKNNGIFIFIDSEYTSNPELREFGIGAQIVKKLGIENMNLLSTTKRKDYIGLSGFGLNINQEIVL